MADIIEVITQETTLIVETAEPTVLEVSTGIKGDPGQDGASNWAEIQGKPSAFPSLSSLISDFSSAVSALLSWANITGKPSTFTPSAHAHEIADTTGLQTALDGKQASGDYATNGDLSSGLAGKANTSHGHTIADVTGLQTALDGKQPSGDYATNGALTTGLAGKANTSHGHEISDTDGLAIALAGKADTDDPRLSDSRPPTGSAGGVLSGSFPNPGFAVDMATQAELNSVASILPLKADLVEGKVPASQLPSFVDDVVEEATFAALPPTGEAGKIYVVTGTNKVYRWSGSAYVEIVASPGSTDAIPEGSVNKYFTDARAQAALAGHTGNTSNPHAVTKAQVGLANVDNTSDANKPVSSAQASAIADAQAAAIQRANHTGTQLAATISDFSSAAQAALSASLAGKANTSHGHTIADVSGLQTALDGKQASGDYATNSALTSALSGKANTSHGHTISDVSGLQTALDGKQPSGDYATNSALTTGLAGKENAGAAASAQAAAIQRANHTGTQLANTVGDFEACVWMFGGI